MIPHANELKLRLYVYKYMYLDIVYEMIDLNTLSVEMLSYDSDINEIISKLGLLAAKITTASILFKRILTYRPKIDPALTNLRTF